MAATSSLYAGGGIKSIQRGTQTQPSGVAGGENTASITSVDTSKSFVNSSVAPGGQAAYYSSWGWGQGVGAGVRLTSSTQLTFRTGLKIASSNLGESEGQIYWEVVEYE